MGKSSRSKAKAKKRSEYVGTVVSTERLTPGMIRIVFGGEGLAGFEVGEFTDHYVKIRVPPANAPYAPPFDLKQVKQELPRELWPRTRSITVRDWDAGRQLLTLDFVDHGAAGYAGPWAARATPGDRLQIRRPGGGYAPDPEADWHLMVGDAAALPAIAVSLKRVPPAVPVFVLAEVAGPREQLPLTSRGDLRLEWVRSGERSLAAAVEALRLPAGRGQAFVHGEADMVREVRRDLLLRGVPNEALSASGYWRRDRTDEAWRAEKSEWKRLAEADLAATAA